MSNNKLFYFSKSRNVLRLKNSFQNFLNLIGFKEIFQDISLNVLPGKGLNEIVENPLIYNDLAKIKDQRKILSNFHIYPFLYEGNIYNTIEHAFQAQKIKIVHNNKALLFTINSGHEIGIGDGLIARKNRKICKLNKEQLQLWDNIKHDIMNKITIEKI